MIGNFALITGASRGLGYSIALELAKRGYDILLIARSESSLKENCEYLSSNYSVNAAYLAIDLSLPESAKMVHTWIEKNNYQLSILINNAGYGLWGNFDALSLPQQQEMCNINMNSVISLSYLLLPNLYKSNKNGYILNVSSTAAYQAVPTLAIYAATKSFVLSFSRALRYELKNSNISVSCLSSGPINTGFAHRAGLDAFSKMAEKFNMQPEVVAKIAIKGMLKNKSEIIPGFVNWISVYANRILPKSFIEKTAANLYKL